MKNFKLLLATTAILSAGLIMNVWAGNPSVEIEAGVDLALGYSADLHDSMWFGVVDSSVGGTLTVNPDGTYDENYTVMLIAPRDIRPASIDFSGGFFHGHINKSNLFTLDLSGKTIDLYIGGDTSKSYCGSVTNLRQDTGSKLENEDTYRVNIGGTLNLESNIDTTPYTDGVSCSGSIEVTYIMNL